MKLIIRGKTTMPFYKHRFWLDFEVKLGLAQLVQYMDGRQPDKPKDFQERLRKNPACNTGELLSVRVESTGLNGPKDMTQLKAAVYDTMFC